MITKRITVTEFLALNNEYMNMYYKLLKNKEPTTLKCEKGYEKHHLIPRCFGGSNDKTNLVKLTTYEHILAHYYLALGTDNIHMFHAFNYMLGRQFEKITDIEKIKLEELQYWAHVREISKARMFSDEAKKTISTKAKQRWQKFRDNGTVEQVKQNISEATKKSMQTVENKIKVRCNLGCKKYWNPETGEQRNWYPGMEPFESPWVRGRGPMMSKEAKEKISQIMKADPHKWYHNDDLMQNRIFKKSETVPDGWKPGIVKKYNGNYAKEKYEKKVEQLNLLKESINDK